MCSKYKGNQQLEHNRTCLTYIVNYFKILNNKIKVFVSIIFLLKTCYMLKSF